MYDALKSSNDEEMKQNADALHDRGTVFWRNN